MFLNKKFKCIIYMIIVCIIFSSCQSTNKNVTDNDGTEIIQTLDDKETESINETLELSDEEKLDNLVDEKIQKMTIEQKIGQMFIVTPETFSNGTTVTSIEDLDIEKMKKYNIGGFVFFQDNILNPSQITKLNNELSQYSLFLGVDEEGGSVARISNNPNFPDERIENMSTVTDPNRAYEIGDTIGKYLKSYGFNLDFAPVADVLLNSENTVVKDRSFGSDPNIVSSMVNNVFKGLNANGILASAKHFPGHGNTKLDTHDGFAMSYSTKEDMENTELVPFEELISSGIDMIMISHVIYPNLSSEDVPATLNKDIVTGLLRDELGYDGVIITDGMNMGAIANNYSSDEAALKAVEAGVDIILMPNDFYSAYDAILNAVNNGTIPEERINESVRRILKLKYNSNIMR